MDNCEKFDLVTTTNEKGEFAFGPVKEFRWIAYIYGDPVSYWALCVDTPEGRRAILSQGGIGMSPEKLEVDCDLSKTKVIFIEGFGNISGKCAGRRLW